MLMHPPRTQLSLIEERFERVRQRGGLALAPALFLALWFAPLPGLTEPAHRLFAVLGAVVTLWLSEGLPLPVTALLGPALCVAVGVAPVREVFRGFGDPILFVYLGGFLIAEAILQHGLNRRIALRILGWRGVGESPHRLLFAFAAVTAFISMWVSNTATTAMMLPIGLAILSEMARMQSRRTGREVRFTDLRYGTALMLVASFASSIGGLATPVGTPPNLVGLGLIRNQLGIEIPFFTWMAFGLPLALVLLTLLVPYLSRSCPAEPELMLGSAQWIREEQTKLGVLNRGEANTLLAFVITVALWVSPGIVAIAAGTKAPAYRWLDAHFPESVVALIGATLLFVLPVNLRQWQFTLSWREAVRIDWGTILLFGGGMALGDLMFSTGLAKWIGEGLAHAFNAKSTFGLILLFTAVATLVSETTSNLASATMVVPVAIAVAQGAGVNPVQPALAACLGASMGFMLPVSTPPNAIVYGSGCIPLLKMVRFGVWLDLIGFAVIVAVTTWLVPIVLKL
jgi:sodium-dependent dicarboxylate transporter 2/3/5